ncbi:hypothetical protein K2173_014430 [Erythroxylum novogranatense]|uniref:AP180 N-terminal homology (ANTH) domain-containing protein n=1 Tax=Erythroxylum novogranatense TaxID=1862640 RepID=A0AAV8S5S9_9ROSI|nr:hypothetical protein K2173_014430 [Erythroxylum novogranatense]
MGQRKKPRALVGILKDTASIIKANLSTKRTKARLHIAVLRTAPHGVSAPPSDKQVASVLSFGFGSRLTASTCIGALMDRLHGTKDASVALKSLFTIHYIIINGSPILKDQLSVYPSFGGRNFLNLSQWYAAVIEQNLTVSRFLGYYLCSDAGKNVQEKKTLALSSKDLLGQLDILVDFVERTCEAPESLHLQRNNLVYEMVRLVGEDYRVPSLSPDELSQLLSILRKFESCKERLFMLFANRRRHDELWELINRTKFKTIETIEKETKALVKTRNTDGLVIVGKRLSSWGDQRKTVNCRTCSFNGLLVIKWKVP